MTTNNSKTLSMSSIVSVDDQGAVKALEISTPRTITLGALTMRSWEGGLHFVHAGENGEGKTPIELQGFEAVAGFLNAWMKLNDNPEMFAVLNETQHIYASTYERDYAAAAGYVLVMVPDPELAGLEKAMWKAVRRENGGFASAGLVNPVSISQARTWKTEAARDENDHKRHIIALHNGFNDLIKVIAGTHTVKFNTFDWKEGSKSVLESKKFALSSTPEYRASVVEEAELRKSIKESEKALDNQVFNGKKAIDSTAPASYIDAMQREVSCQLFDLIGGLYTIRQTNGRNVTCKYSVNNEVQAANLMKTVRALGVGAALIRLDE